MATSLTNVFGDEISVVAQPHEWQKQYSGFAGAHGLTCINMGSRGYKITVKGRLRGNIRSSYDSARSSCQSLIDSVSVILSQSAADYSYKGKTYYDIEWEAIQLIGDSSGNYYHWNLQGQVYVDFVATGRSLR